MLKIALGNRDYKKTWGGGDIQEMLAWRVAFKKLGHDCFIVNPKDIQGCDVFWGFNIGWGWTEQMAAKYKEIGAVTFASCILFPEQQPKSYENIDKVILYSEKELNNLNVKPDFEKVIYQVNGFDDDIFKNNTDWTDREDVVFTYQVQKHPRKNVEMLVEACRNLCRAYVIGDGYGFGDDYVTVLKNTTQGEIANICNSVKIVGAVGYNDPFSNTIKEGLACGCNVVYSETSYCDWGRDKSCYSCDPYDIESMRDVVKEALRNKPTEFKPPTYLEQADKMIKLFEEMI